MSRSPEHSGTAGRTAARWSLDRRVLLGTLILMLSLFGTMWIAARGFLPGAKLFPDVLACLGIAVTLIALLRVWRGVEPGESPGQAVQEGTGTVEAYCKAGGYLCCTAIYYVGIFLIGFLPATALLLALVARAYSESYRYAIAATAAGLVAVYVLSSTLDLYLPPGWIIELFVGG